MYQKKINYLIVQN